jgi:molybdate transport system regulatory protein
MNPALFNQDIKDARVTNRLNEDRPNGLVNAELQLIGGLTERFFGLLAAIDAIGSISRAAREAGLSYKGAWDMLERANNLSPRVLVSTQTGGRQGGGAYLTPAGKKLLDVFRRIQEEHRRFLNELNAGLLEDPELRVFFRRLVIRASARNQLFGRIEAIRGNGAEVEVDLRIKGGDRLVATITRTSADALKLKPGREVVALIKAPQVMVVKNLGGYHLSARNQLSGVVERIQKGAINTEVIIYLPGGDSIAATLTNSSLERMNLEEGDAATAVFKSGAVVLGVAES